MFFHVFCLKTVILYGGILEFAASHTATVARVGQSVNMTWSVSQSVTNFKIRSITYNNRSGSTVLFIVVANKLLSASVNTHTQNGTRIQLNVSTSMEGRKQVMLIFHSVDVQDVGVYNLTTHNSDVSPRTQLLIVLQKPSEPNIITRVADPVSGDPVNLTCSTTFQSLPTDQSLYPYTLTTSYTWRRNNSSVNSRVDNRVHVDGQFLTVDPVTKEDKGVYSCQSGEEGLLSDWSQGYTLNVLYGPDQIQFDGTRDKLEVEGGKSVTVECSAVCNPACTVTWWNTHRQMAITGHREAVLSIPAVDVSVSGQYTCHVNNSHGSSSRNLTLAVITRELTESDVVYIVPVAAAYSVLIVVIAFVIVALVFRKNRLKKGSKVYRAGDRSMADNEAQFQQDPSDLYAKVDKKKNLLTLVSDVYATVQETQCRHFMNRAYAGAGPSSENAVLIDYAGPVAGEYNCGETNDDGLTYADPALELPTLIDGKPIIHRREEPAVYEQIDFSLSPGPQLPDKMEEQVEEQEEEERRQCLWESK
ncbi:cell adhesion molecule 4-like [Haliotis asinina]|uniref:cell adhesion molecule 4-like n=1 Tax=Haliotis asinina TaxID=109174 RepID=UPI003531F826